jgi:predicted RNA methylase
MQTDIDKLADQIWYLLQNKVVMMPTLGDYPAYDDLEYAVLDRAYQRNEAYERVIKRKVRNKTVVEIGPGARLLLTRMCVDAGATKIYAIEADEKACQSARDFAFAHGLADKIEVVHGLSTEVDLPEPVDVCLSEIIGSIGDSEGAVRYLRNAKRFLKPDGIMIPSGCLTWLSPVFKPTEVYHDPLIDQMINAATQTAYEKLGHQFEFTRYEIFNFPAANLIAPPQCFEAYWFDAPNLADTLDMQLTFVAQVDRPFDGVLLWIHLYVDQAEMIDAFSGSCWAPVYIAMEPFEVRQGDVIEVHGHSELSRNGFNPDYTFAASIHRQGQIVYRHLSEASYA